LPKIPKKPKVYCTSTSKETIKKYKDKKLHSKLYGIVGPIMGVSGLLVGLSKKKKIDSIALLAETYNHPMYLGINGAKEILKLINKKFELKLDLKKLDKESKKVDKQLLESMGEIYSMAKKEKGVDTTYIG
ncbi:PAC2 family protein, partial [Candidatus Woesearchaeota archaeon]|nr:PAC2 family protein [Candidatus Woesearchaeota archaeon]